MTSDINVISSRDDKSWLSCVVGWRDALAMEASLTSVRPLPESRWVMGLGRGLGG